MNEEPTLGEIGRQIDSLRGEVRRVLDDHESRLRGVEKWMYALPSAFLLGAVSLIVTVVTR